MPPTTMPASTRIPPLLQPYLQLSREESLLLVTSTLGASANWLLTRYISNALNNTQDGGQDEGHNVVLVSFMREYEFWRQEARKGAGLDLEKVKKEGRFAFVDGLSNMCLGGGSTPGNATPPQRGPRVISSAATTSRGLPVRGPPGSQDHAPIPPSTTVPQSTATDTNSLGLYTLTSLDMTHITNTITSALSALSTSPSSTRKTFIILDNPDILLALTQNITPQTLSSLILTLHTHPSVSHVLTHIHSDTPLLAQSVPPQPLEHAQHNFLVKMGHMSRRIIGVRVLDTGVARDISGVIRITEQSDGWGDFGFGGEVHGDSASRDQASEGSGQGKEFLYQVKGDGGVKVFERGAGGEG